METKIECPECGAKDFDTDAMMESRKCLSYTLVMRVHISGGVMLELALLPKRDRFEAYPYSFTSSVQTLPRQNEVQDLMLHKPIFVQQNERGWQTRLPVRND